MVRIPIMQDLLIWFAMFQKPWVVRLFNARSARSKIRIGDLINDTVKLEVGQPSR